MARAVRKAPAPPPRPSRASHVLTASAIALAAAWFATAPAFPPAPARPVPTRTLVPHEHNAMPYVGAGDPVRFPPGPRETWSRRLLNASYERRPVPPEVQAVVASNPEVLAEVRKSARRPRFRMTGGYGVPPLDSQLWGFFEVGRLAVVAFRVGGPGGRPDPGRLVDALGLARRALWAPQEAAAVSEAGAGVAESAYDAERAERARLLALPVPALEELLRGLNGLDRVEIPLRVLLAGHRDHALLPAGLEAGEEQFEEGQRWLVAPMLGWLREGAGRVADARIEAIARRDFAGHDAIVGRYPEPGALTYGLHPFDALARSTGATMPLDAWAHRVLCAEARFDALRVGLAAELYRRAHGGWPITLAALVPAYLPAVPKDPYAPARPLGWDGWTVYSVGPDGDDDRARRGRRAGAWPPPFDRDGDFLLWPDVGFAAAR